jgi:tetratricopeptide (TPR) repeat protein
MDYQTAVLESYQEKNFLRCLTLIDDCPVKKAKDSPHYRVLKAACFVNLGIQRELTHRILDEVLGEDDSNEFAIYCKGLAFFNEKNFEEAIKCFDKAIELNPKGMAKAEVMRSKALMHLEPPKMYEVESRVKQEANPVKSLSCIICSKTFGSYSNLKRHTLLHSGDKPHRCCYCSLG